MATSGKNGIVYHQFSIQTLLRRPVTVDGKFCGEWNTYDRREKILFLFSQIVHKLMRGCLNGVMGEGEVYLLRQSTRCIYNIE